MLAQSVSALWLSGHDLVCLQDTSVALAVGKRLFADSLFKVPQSGAFWNLKIGREVITYGKRDLHLCVMYEWISKLL